ncbi:SRPBCC family protein [Bacillus shivajii]|uniref:SRPBCC family protein n=1 Tax=Bacillus shivajii TaxID=1983719 RepID=UPI001CFB756B|nr:SRPBCC family protein [Bacillus shivajii]UCZ52964.1 SRPBCC family protein [Bacillus shivajii]
MPEFKYKQLIQAPMEVCFELARNVDIHMQITKDQAVCGVTEGLLEEGDNVTWEVQHFGIKQRLTAMVSFMDSPHKLVIMVRGTFQTYTHIREFFEVSDGTMMVGMLEYRSPFGLVGILADKLFLERYMQTLIKSRAKTFKKIAEAEVSQNLKGDTSSQ